MTKTRGKYLKIPYIRGEGGVGQPIIINYHSGGRRQGSCAIFLGGFINDIEEILYFSVSFFFLEMATFVHFGAVSFFLKNAKFVHFLSVKLFSRAYP